MHVPCRLLLVTEYDMVEYGLGHTQVRYHLHKRNNTTPMQLLQWVKHTVHTSLSISPQRLVILIF